MNTQMQRTKGPLPLEGVRSDYEIAKRNSRFRRRRPGVGTVGTSADYHYSSEADFLYTMEYARDLDRNDLVAGMCLDRLLDNILQESGISPDPDTGDENMDDRLKLLWQQWALNEDSCDLAGEMAFPEIERTVLRSTLVDGDVVVLPNESGALELMEAHRLRTPRNTRRNVVHGVLLAEDRRRLQYWFTRDELDPLKAFSRVSDVIPVSVRDEGGSRQVFHVYNPDRCSQTRGVSVFRRCSDALGMHDDIQFANLVRQQIASCFAFIRERDGKSSGLPGDIQFGSRTTTTEGGYTRTVDNISPGMQVKTDPGEKITGFSPNIPNPQFFEHATLILKLISANLNLPLHAVLLDASQTNFSGWRGAIDQARSGFRRVQGWLIRKFHARVYRWKVRQWLSEDPELQAWSEQSGVDPFRCKWNKPTWEYIEPLKDAAADAAKVKGLLCSLRSVHNRRGYDLDDVAREIVRDNVKIIRMAREAARELNSDLQEESERVTWRETLTLPVPEGMTFSLAANVSGDDDADTSKEAANE